MTDQVVHDTRAASAFGSARALTEGVRAGFQSRLGRRLVFMTLFFSSILAIFLTIVQLSIEYIRDLREMDWEIASVEKSTLPTLAESIWRLDVSLVKNNLDGIARVPGVVEALVRTEDGEEIVARGGDESIDNYYVYPLVRGPKDSGFVLGELRIAVSHDAIRARLYQRFTLILFANVLRTLGVATIILVLHHHIVGRRLSQLNDHVVAYAPDTAPEPLDWDAQQETDELTMLGRSMEGWIQKNYLLLSKIRSVSKEQSDFNYALSHDLKSPINTLQLLHVALREDREAHWDDEEKEMFSALELTTDRMIRMIQDVEVYSSTIGERFPVAPVDLSAEIQTVLLDQSLDASEAGAMIRVGDFPTILGNAPQIRLLFQNLLANAIKFRDPDRALSIAIDWELTDKGEYAIYMQDNGIGIEESHLKSIFDLFKRLHVYEVYQGSGVGLSICRRIAENHEGRIEARSTLGEGTRFMVILPAHLVPEDAPQPGLGSRPDHA